MKKITKSLYIWILFIAFVGGGCTVDVIDRGGDTDDDDDDDDVVVETTDTYAVDWMDGILSIYYLYNDEYNTLTRDNSLAYSEFLDATLKSMTTNVLDYKDDAIYSYVYRSVSTKGATTRISDSKVYEVSLGLAKGLNVEYTGTSYCGFAVSGVYANSPLYDAGVRRGDVIVSVNDAQLTSSNISGWSQLLLSPSYSGVTYTLGFEDGTSIDVSSTYMQCNPILYSEVYEEGDKKIGCVSYLSFDAAWDDELMELMAEFKVAGVTDLILDMRLNGGGYINTANKLSSAIGGEATSDKVFVNYRFNDTRMASLSDIYKVSNFMSNWSEYHLDLDNIICLVKAGTASASELVINSLRGIGVEVVLIGKQTEGKNVGSEQFSVTYGGYDYEFYPITMELSNAEEFNDYADGFTVDYEVDDWGDNGDAFSDYGEGEIMISTALSYIVDGSFSTTRSTSVTSRSGGVVAPKTQGEVLSASFIPAGNIYLAE